MWTAEERARLVELFQLEEDPGMEYFLAKWKELSEDPLKRSSLLNSNANEEVSFSFTLIF
jgi:hypothetical protein